MCSTGALAEPGFKAASFQQGAVTLCKLSDSRLRLRWSFENIVRGINRFFSYALRLTSTLHSWYVAVGTSILKDWYGLSALLRGLTGVINVFVKINFSPLAFCNQHLSKTHLVETANLFLHYYDGPLLVCKGIFFLV